MSESLEDPSYRFSESIRIGNLEETFKNYSLREEPNLAVLKRFIFSSQDLTPERLSNIQQTVNRMYPNEHEIVSQVNALARHRLLDLPSELFTFTSIKARIDGASNRARILTDLLEVVGIESIFNPLISDDDKKWLAQLIRESHDLESIKSILGQLMETVPDFIMMYLPDLLIDFHDETMLMAMGFEERMLFAKSCMRIDPELLIKKLGRLFTPREKSENFSQFMDLIDFGIANLENETLKQSLHYLKQNNLELRDVSQSRVSSSVEAQPSFDEKLESFRKIFASSSNEDLFFQQPFEDFADHFFRMFTVPELQDNLAKILPVIDDAIQNLTLRGHSTEKTVSYLEKHKLYLKRLSEGNEASDKDCHHWDCLGEHPSDSGVYVFKLKQQYEEFSDSSAGENLFIFPAVEPLQDSRGQELLAQILKSKEYSALGFKYEPGVSGVYVTIPSAITLEAKWEELRQTRGYNNLPKLTCGESDGIASAEEFMNILDENDLLISKNKELLHDMMIHALATIATILSNPSAYKTNRAYMRGVRANVKVVLAKYTNVSSEMAEDRAAAALIYEMVAIFYDLVTGDGNSGSRTSLIRNWEDGSVFDVIGHQSRYNWLPVLWKNENLRQHLQALGVRSAYAAFPAGILREKWLKFESEYEVDRQKSVHSLQDIKVYTEELRVRLSQSPDKSARIAINLLESLGIESIVERLNSEDDKAWFAQLIRKNVDRDSAKTVLNQLMEANPGFVMHYLPDLFMIAGSTAMILSTSLDQRMAFAERCMEIAPEILGWKLANIFTAKEIEKNRKKMTRLAEALIEALNVELRCLDLSEKNAAEDLEKIKNQVKKFKKNIRSNRGTPRRGKAASSS